METTETAFEHILMNSYKEQMISSVKTHPEYFDEAIKLAISDKQPYSWRSAWLLWSCMSDNDERIQGYIEKIVDVIKTKNDNHQRELLKILLRMELDEKYEGLLFDICITIWESINKKPSIRFTAFKFMIKIVKKHPDLYNEITFLTEERYVDLLSSAIKKSIFKMLNECKVSISQ